MRAGLVMAAMLLLGACGGGEDREGDLSSDEEQQLNDAAAMLDEPAEESGEFGQSRADGADAQ